MYNTLIYPLDPIYHHTSVGSYLPSYIRLILPTRGAFALPKQKILDKSINSIAWVPFFTHNPYEPLPDNETKQLRLHYYMAITWADYAAGQVLNEVEALGISDNTLIMVHAGMVAVSVCVADHGACRYGSSECMCR
jgi:hypothetical protein